MKQFMSISGNYAIYKRFVTGASGYAGSRGKVVFGKIN